MSRNVLSLRLETYRQLVAKQTTCVGRNAYIFSRNNFSPRIPGLQLITLNEIKSRIGWSARAKTFPGPAKYNILSKAPRMQEFDLVVFQNFSIASQSIHVYTCN